jgi:chromosome segregation protein
LHLSKLELHGFKSFPYRTELRFEQGITAVVGPNGCGKTNLLDALRWVLGEQRVSLLRGAKMEEVIFNGTSALKPLGMAEVTVTISNETGRLQSEFKEVAVTRRLHRSGESEYLLNRLPCRLRDIVDLFLNTGMGTHAYSVIQPEMIDAILSDKAEERRFLFEEAAGITKYKRRRREALSRLESTEADLVRIEDLYSEVEKQYNSLKRQVAKARRFQKLKELQREMECEIAREELHRLRGAEEERTRSAGELQNELAALAVSTATSSAKLEELHDRSSTLEGKLQELSKRLTEVIEKAHEAEKENSTERERIVQSKDLKEKCELELRNIEKRRAEISERSEAIKQEIRGKSEKLEDKRAAHQEATGRLGDLEEKLLQTKKTVSSRRGEKEELTGRLSELHAEAKLLEERLAEVDESLSRLEESGSQLREEEKTTAERISSFAASVEEEQSHCRRLEEKLKRGHGESTELQEEIRVTTDTLHRREKESAEIGARRESLQAILVGYQDYQEATQEILSKKEDFHGVIDSVANLLTVEGSYTAAIESALGPASSYIVCRDTESALKAASFIRENGFGQACFLPLDRIPKESPLGEGSENPSPRPSVTDSVSLLGWASELVQTEQEWSGVAELLLGNALVVSDFEAALRASEDLPGGYRAVTLEGEQVLSGGALKAGRLSGEQRGPLSRKSELELLESRAHELERELEETRQHLEELLQRQRQLEDRLNSDENEIKQRRERIIEQEKEKSSLEYRLSSVRENLDKNNRELEESQERRSQLSQRRETLRDQIQQLEKDSEERELDLEGTSTDLESLEMKLRSETTEVNRLLVEIMNLETGVQNMQGNLSTNDELLSQLQGAEERWRRELEGTEERAALAERSISDNLRRLSQINREKESLERERLDMTSERSRILGEITDLDREQKSRQAQREETREKLHQLNLKQVEIEGKAKTIKDRIWEEYSLKLEEAEERPENEVDLPKPQEELEGVRAKLNSLGPVNLLALEDFRGVSDRLEFLTKQKKDLTEAKTQLRQAIVKINRTARERFEETFEYARNNFYRVFSELFEGGETVLKLTDPGDPLESPIEISVRPRGKRFIPLTQLSGGERALTAISLLFAIYLIKPSPFCILDEIDAPLDDANTQRFLKMIKRFSRNTQFVVITHNKLTMEAADVLYGITMEEPGISKVVSVRFNRPEEVTAEVA